MNLTGLIFVLLAQFISGAGMLYLFRVQLKPVAAFCISMMLGLVLISLIPCALQLMHRPITAGSVGAGMVILAGICIVPTALLFRRLQFARPVLPQLYELPFLLVVGILVVISVWRCFYYPPTPRDVLAGGEMLAEFTVREKTMLNSVYGIDLHTTNNYFKSPYLSCLQVIYKLWVCPFGQLWLSTLFLPFIIFLYSLLRKAIHPYLAGFLLMIFMAIPDLFAYSFIILYDYSNMVYFFTGFYFLYRYLEDKDTGLLVLSAVLFGMSTYVRVETLVLVGMTLPMLIFVQYRARVPLARILARCGVLLGVSVFFYVLCMNVFIKHFVPIPIDTASQMNKHILDVTPFFKRFAEMHTELIFDHRGVTIYAYYIYFFLCVLLADVVLVRKFDTEARYALYGVAVIYLGLPFLGYLLPLFDLHNTTKRGLFKILPFMLIYMANSPLLQRLSGLLYKREHAGAGIPAQPAVRPAVAQPKAKKKK